MTGPRARRRASALAAVLAVQALCAVFFVADVVADLRFAGWIPHTLFEASVKAPRVHHQWLPDKIQIEEGALPADVQDALVRMGHTVAIYKDSAGKVSPIGDFQAIRIDPQTGTLEGVSDPRGPGEPRGY